MAALINFPTIAFFALTYATLVAVSLAYFKWRIRHAHSPPSFLGMFSELVRLIFCLLLAAATSAHATRHPSAGAAFIAICFAAIAITSAFNLSRRFKAFRGDGSVDRAAETPASE